MSTLVTSPTNTAHSQPGRSRNTVWDGEALRETLQTVKETVPPVWPLEDFVAVNPFLGLTGHSFLKARRFLQMFSDCESLMPLSYYRSRIADGKLGFDDIAVALQELAKDGMTVAELLTAQDILDLVFRGLASRQNARPGQRHVLPRPRFFVLVPLEALETYRQRSLCPLRTQSRIDLV